MSSLLAFHAHPDDESVSTGVTLAKYADEGHRVVVATATDGSAGEIHNYDNPEELFPKLAEMRRKELEASLEALGVKEYEWMGFKDFWNDGVLVKMMIQIVSGDRTILIL
jgi:Uncharacterized proteins, LmbE homologs